jgi:hypothetical protein
MTTLRLKKTNGGPPRAAKIEGTKQKYVLTADYVAGCHALTLVRA